MSVMIFSATKQTDETSGSDLLYSTIYNIFIGESMETRLHAASKDKFK
jgi:hypothetical protein